MSNSEGYILTIEGCPYAFCTNGAEIVVPQHPEWASTWFVLPNILVNPSEYVSWDERTLPIEGDLEVSSIAFKLNDIYYNSLTLYDSTTFTGNILTELFTRSTPRQSEYKLTLSVVSSSATSGIPAGIDIFNEVVLIDDPSDSPAASYSPTQIQNSYDLTGLVAGVVKPIWIEDEAMYAVGTTGIANSTIQIGTVVGVESGAGRGIYGTERKYHRISAEGYEPEIFFKHPLIIKRGCTLWRVDDATNNSAASIYPIWNGFIRNNPELSGDGGTFILNAEHKWTFYKNEALDYAAFGSQNFSIPPDIYSVPACFATFNDDNSIPGTGVAVPPAPAIEPNFGIYPTRWEKFRNTSLEAFRGNIVNPLGTTSSEALPAAVGLRRSGEFWQMIIEGVPSSTALKILCLPAGPTSVGGYYTGAVFCGRRQTLATVNNWCTTGQLGNVAIDYVEGNNDYWMPYITSRRSGFMPTAYMRLNNYLGDTNTTIEAAFLAKGSDLTYVFVPRTPQSSFGGPTQRYLQGTVNSYDSETMDSTATVGTIQFIEEELQFKPVIKISSNQRTTIETIAATLLRPRSEITLLNHFSSKDFDLTNLDSLKNWVGGIDPPIGGIIQWFLTDETKFFDFIKPYLKLFSYIAVLKNGRIGFNTYDTGRQTDHTLIATDFIELPSTLSTLPENLFNTLKIKVPNFPTEFVYNDPLSKGRYKAGNTQEIELPARLYAGVSPMQTAIYFQSIAKRLLSIWGYPQFVAKFKTSLSKIDIELGSIVVITDWLVPNFSNIAPDRGLVNRKSMVIGRTVDLSKGEIEFTVVYQEVDQTSFYSPCARIVSAATVNSQTVITLEANYIKPTYKKEPSTTVANVYNNAPETSDYAGSNRLLDYQARFPNQTQVADDGGTFTFTSGDTVEILSRDNTSYTTFPAYDETAPNIQPVLKVISTDNATRQITLNRNIAVDAPSLFSLMNNARSLINPLGFITEIRYAPHVHCQDSQQQEYAWIGDITFESLDFPLPVPPATRILSANQFSP